MFSSEDDNEASVSRKLYYVGGISFKRSLVAHPILFGYGITSGRPDLLSYPNGPETRVKQRLNHGWARFHPGVLCKGITNV